MLEFSLIIPVYNEQDRLNEVYQNLVSVLNPITDEYEIIFVDNGSTDGSLEIIRQLREADDHVCFVRLNQNYGPTSAFDAGARNALGDVVLSLDPGKAVDARRIPDLLEHLAEYDAVFGYQTDLPEPAQRPFAAFIRPVKNFFRRPAFRNVETPLKVIQSYVLRKVKLFDGVFHLIPDLVRREGFSVCEVPINRPTRLKNSRNKLRNRFLSALRDSLTLKRIKQNDLQYSVIEKG